MTSFVNISYQCNNNGKISTDAVAPTNVKTES